MYSKYGYNGKLRSLESSFCLVVLQELANHKIKTRVVVGFSRLNTFVESGVMKAAAKGSRGHYS